MEPKKIESMDDLRATMKDPEIQAANKAFSKKYLKANRPKSLAVISLAIIAVFLLMTLSSHKASSVTPTALRTAEEVSWSLDGQAETVLTAQQREDLISLLDGVKVKRLMGGQEGQPDAPALCFTAGGDSFTLTRGGQLYTDSSVYTFSDGEEVWSRLDALLSFS